MLNADALRNEKVKVLTAIRPVPLHTLSDYVVRAQYRSYRDEPNVDPKSETPTYAALKLYVDNWRWHGVPFYLRSGKGLAERQTQIVVQFKCPPVLLFALKDSQTLAPNMLAIEIQPFRLGRELSRKDAKDAKNFKGFALACPASFCGVASSW